MNSSVENEKFEIRAETTVTFEVFRKFFLDMMSRNKLSGFLLRFSPYIFLTGLFFCFLDMIIFKEDSVGGFFLIIVLLMGAFMLFLYLVPPRSAYNAVKKEFSLPYKYIFTESGFSVGRADFDCEKFISYEDIDIIFESETSFYFGYNRKTCIIEKSDFNGEDVSLLSGVLKCKNPRKYTKIKN